MSLKNITSFLSLGQEPIPPTDICSTHKYLGIKTRESQKDGTEVVNKLDEHLKQLSKAPQVRKIPL